MPAEGGSRERSERREASRGAATAQPVRPGGVHSDTRSSVPGSALPPVRGARELRTGVAVSLARFARSADNSGARFETFLQ
jgi:hypothetical protein